MEHTERLTPKEAAKWLRVSPVTVYRLLHDGTIPFRKVGRAYRISLPDLEAHGVHPRVVQERLGHSTIA